MAHGCDIVWGGFLVFSIPIWTLGTLSLQQRDLNNQYTKYKEKFSDSLLKLLLFHCLKCFWWHTKAQKHTHAHLAWFVRFEVPQIKPWDQIWRVRCLTAVYFKQSPNNSSHPSCSFTSAGFSHAKPLGLCLNVSVHAFRRVCVKMKHRSSWNGGPL